MRPERIPLFPLNVVLLPGAELPLHIFEPRYRQMVKDCLEEKSEFGMVLSLDKGVARVGCTAEIVQVAKRYPDGRMDILTIGRAPFRVVELFTADLLLEGQVDYLEDREFPTSPGIQRELVELFEACHTIIFDDYPKNLEGASTEDFSYLVAATLPMDLLWKQQILELRSEADRQERLVAYLREWAPHLQKKEAKRKRAGANGHGFPDFDPSGACRSVKNELRRNLLRSIEKGETLFPGVHGYEDTVVPQIANALLSRHNFILLGLRGQAKSRILRGLVNLLDPEMPVVAGCEINDDPFKPICRACREKIACEGDDTPIAWMPREDRFVEKLATPDVTMADIIGDVDPIRAARGGRDLSDELTIHYGLLPRANRGIFAINELPDLAGKIQVGLFNIMQEGDIQIKGYPLRLPLDVLIVFTANPEDYTARGKIITPLKDRIGAEIRTHYPATIEEGMTITAQEAWVGRDSGKKIDVPPYLLQAVEEIAFQAREDKRVDRRSGVSQRLPITTLESLVSSAEQRAARNGEKSVVARVADVYAALPAITGKMELEYEGELKGADTIARELIRTAVGRVFSKHFTDINFQPVIQWFELGGELKLPDLATTSERYQQLSKIHGLMEHVGRLGVSDRKDTGAAAAAAEMILEGLWAHRRIGRSEERGFYAEKPRQPDQREREGPPRPPRRQFN